MRQPLSSAEEQRYPALLSKTSPETRWAWALFFALCSFGVLYRLRLIGQLFLDSDNIYRLSMNLSTVTRVGMQVWREILLAGVIALAFCIPWRAMERRLGEVVPAWIEWTGLLLLQVFLFLFAFWHAAHLRLMFTMSTGVTWNMLQESKTALSLVGLYKQTFLLDYVSVLSVFALFGLFWKLFSRPQRWVRTGLLSSGYLLLLVNLLCVVSAGNPASPLVRENPILFSLENFGSSRTKKTTTQQSSSARPSSFFQDPCGKPPATASAASPTRVPGAKKSPAKPRLRSQVLALAGQKLVPDKRNRYLTLPQRDSVKLVGKTFLRSLPPGLRKRLPLRRDGKKWNVLLVVLESTGARYVFDTSRGNRVPMPFLKSLTQKSLYLKNHYSTANSSPRAVFSLFSGLYPTPRVKMFSLRSSNRLPSLATFLGEGYNPFLITPGAVKWYFPKWFLKRSGLRRMEGYFSLPPMKYGPGPKEGRNELNVTDYFNRQLQRAKQPFFATYISFAPHYPYFDYGKKYRILPNRRKRLHRYMNNLVVLDEALRRIFATLRKTGLHDNTIVMMVGDHSEAFGQHYRNWIHSRFSFNENLRVPALLYQPALFKPRVVTEPTSHVDLLPTLLDAMRVSYNPLLLQGESLLRGPLQRKYIFAYGNEDTVSVINRSNEKLQLDFANKRCWWFSLKKDPGEKRKIDCRSRPWMRSAALRFWQRQPTILSTYNRSWRRKRSFRRLQHPSIPSRSKNE